ncbi:MAG: methionine synthase [Pseudomonadota bacterium]
MNDHDQKDPGDSKADAMATTAIVAVIICAVVFWLAGMPS